MAMISVTCRRCGNKVEADDAFLGETLYCPSCNSAVKIVADEVPSAPAAAAAPADALAPAMPDPAPVAAPAKPVVAAPRLSVASPKLRLAGDRIASGEGRACPKCSFVMAEDDIVCANCGHNTKTGVSMAEVARRRDALNQLLRLSTSVLVLVALGWLVWKAGWLKFNVRDVVMDVVSPAESNAAPDAVTNAGPPVPELPPPAPEVVDQVRQEIQADFQRRFPVVDDGAEVALDRADGRILRGVFRSGKDPGMFALETAAGAIETHELSKLRPAFRLRCDPDYRDAEIERQLKQRLGL